MRNKNYLVLNQEGQHEYDLKVVETEKETSFELYRSSGEQWTEHIRGTLAMSMFNDGNCVGFNKDFKNLDFAQLTEMRILINFENMTDENPLNREKFRVIEDNAILEL